MFGLRYLKVPPTTYVLHYRGGKLVREGAGQAFWYFSPTAMIVQVPVSSQDVPFVFTEVTSDFQDVTIQGELTYRVRDAKRLSGLLDFSVDPWGRYRSDDPGKLKDRLIHAVQLLARSFTQKRTLKQLLASADAFVGEILVGLREAESVQMLGIEVLGLSLVGIKPTPEMAKAFQAEARENLLRQADEAVYARRNIAVQLERTIKENELDTEIAVEAKRRTVRESQMAADIAVEQQRVALVDSRAANDRKEAEARGAALQATLEPIKHVDWRTLLAVNAGADPKLMITLAFQELAQNAQKIGELNISPELLDSLLRTRRKE